MADTTSFPNFSEPDLPDRMTPEAAQTNRFTQAALDRHKQEGIWLAVRARWAALAVVAVFLIYLNPAWNMLFYHCFLLASAGIGWLQTRVGRVGRSQPELAVLFLDVLVFVTALTVPNPFATSDWPNAMLFRFENFPYLFIVLALSTLSYSWRTIIAVGVWSVTMWFIALALLWTFSQPDAELGAAAQIAFGHDPQMLALLDPNSFNFDLRIQNAVILILAAVILGVSNRRFNRLLLGNAALERERENLSRYFSPNVVDELSHNDEPLKQIRSHDVAIVFVDIKGFTRFAADRSPEAVIATLRAFHSRMETCVFAYSGTLDKYLGDGLMASFGTPMPAEDDVVRAYMCARRMIETAHTWNAERSAAGEPELAISIGVHTGPVVLGDIGGARLEFAVIGNTVNIASRVEGLSRELDARLVISDETRAALPEDIARDLKRYPDQRVAGLDHAITVWAC